MVRREIMAFTATERIVHWLHTAAFIVLLFTGLALYVPVSAFAIAPAGQACRLLHRIGAVVFALVPLIYIISDPWGLVNAMREIFTWSAADFGWLGAAPAYYFLSDEEAMPPQPRFNTGQKLFYVVVVICMVVLGVTGLIMWFDKGRAPSGVLQWSVYLHDLATIAVTSFFLVHLYLSVIHPVMEGALSGMVWGWIPEEYVQAHHRKWYEEIIEAGAKESGGGD